MFKQNMPKRASELKCTVAQNKIDILCYLCIVYTIESDPELLQSAVKCMLKHMHSSCALKSLKNCIFDNNYNNLQKNIIK